MAESNVSPATLAARAHLLNLRQLQEDALESLIIATSLAGLGLIILGAQFPETFGQYWAGYPLYLLLYPIYRLLQGHYRLRAWLLVLSWFGTALAVVATLPGTPAPSVLAVPVALAILLISAPAGLLTGLGVTAAIVALVRDNPDALPITSAAVAVALAWGMLALLWLALRPLHEALRWSWQRYEQARTEVEEMRDAQANLKQALKDLAEAGAQTVRLNQLLGAARRVAEEAERAKAEFVANVSHELRTPLNMIIGFTEMIMRSPGVYGERIPPALLADLGVVYRNSEHLSSLIDDVLDLSQMEAGRMALTRERVTLGEIVEAAVVAVRPLFESKGLYLKTDIPADLPALFCDRTRIREVVLNLLSNAGRFTEQGGVHVRARQEGAEIVVSVTDTGPGISAADQDRLFRPFEQLDGSTRRRWGGTGLGLTISKRFVELHGGRMGLESQVGAGATFYFRLPVDPPSTGEAGLLRWVNPEWEYRQRTRRSPVPVVSPRPRLLLVERDDTLQRLLSRYLDDVEIVVVGTLDQALDEIARLPAHALVCNAASVAQTLQELNAATLPEGVPVILCSVPGIGQAAAELGVREYLVKPVSRERLLGALERLGLSRGTVLIVDDEPEARRLFWRMLASAEGDYRVLTAASGQEAVEVLKTDRPDCLLLDLAMPDMDGFQLLEILNQDPALRDIPTVVISALDPLGQPIVSSGFALTRKGGLALHELLACIDAGRQIVGTRG